MNIVIFSGGTGSIALQNGLKSFIPDCHITNIINAYDDGKSTGICREIMHVVGPSDIRKNHLTQYRNKYRDNENRNYIEFLEDRFDIPLENEEEFCKKKLKNWGISCFNLEIECFFAYKSANAKYKNIALKDFNIANIVYAVLLSSTNFGDNKFYKIKTLLNIDDNIVVNTYYDFILRAETHKHKYLMSEAEIVNYKVDRKVDYIEKIYLNKRTTAFPKHKDDDIEIASAYNISSMQEAIESADVIIYSAGTQWSSLIPTYITPGLKEMLEASTAKKILVMNLTNDKDMIGWTGDEVLDLIKQYVPIDAVIKDAFNNLDETISMLDTSGDDNIQYYLTPLVSDVKKSLHDPDKLAAAILSIKFNLTDNIGTFMLDFDDTLWSRDSDVNSVKCSTENVRLLNNIAEYMHVAIVSGNSYDSLRKKLSTVFGSSIDVNFDIWADNASIQYKNNENINIIEDSALSDNQIYVINSIIESVAKDWTLKIEYRGADTSITDISMKPISDSRIRKLATAYINAMLQCNELTKDIIAVATGRTTIDISKKSCSKKNVYNHYLNHPSVPKIINGNSTRDIYYIGDECDNGNDSDIAKICSNFYQVNTIYETNAILKLLQIYLTSRAIKC